MYIVFEDIFFKKFFLGGHDSFLCHHWYPCVGPLVTSQLGFKARLGSLIPIGGGIVIIHSLRLTSGVTPANFFAVSMAAEPSLPHTCEALLGLKTRSYHATTHSVRSDSPAALLTELSWLSHCSQCEIWQARHSTDWAIPTWPPLTVWDQARHSTDRAIPAWPSLTVWDQAGQTLYRLSYPSLATTHSVRSVQTLYRLSYPSLAITHSVRSGRPDALPTELSWRGHHLFVFTVNLFFSVHRC